MKEEKAALGVRTDLSPSAMPLNLEVQKKNKRTCLSEPSQVLSDCYAAFIFVLCCPHDIRQKSDDIVWLESLK